MILKQMNAFAMEINIINLRLQVIQNMLVTKNLVLEAELEAEWNKLMSEAKSLAAQAQLVTPEGQTIIPTSPDRAQTTAGKEAFLEENKNVPEIGATGPAEGPTGSGEVGHA
jgi:hypothetical protein